MRFILRFEMCNASFADASEQEAGRILETVAQRVRKGDLEGPCVDSNGNTVGKFKIIGPDPERSRYVREFAAFIADLMQ